MFTADYSSSTASTPIPKSKLRNFSKNETPELASTTPLAPPPSKVFGSSQIGSGVSKLQYTRNARDLPSQAPGAGKATHPTTQGNTFGLSTDSYDEEMDEEEEEEDDEDFEDDEYTQQSRDLDFDTFNTGNVPSLMKFSTNNQPQSRLTKSTHESRLRVPHYSALSHKGNESYVPGLVRDLKKRQHPATLQNDPDGIIIHTEEILRSLQADLEESSEISSDIKIADAAKELEQIWEGSVNIRRRRKDEELTIGPGHGATPFENGRFIAILLLRLHNSRKVMEENGSTIAIYMPEILLNWLNDYHNTLSYSYARVKTAQPNVTSDEFFWDAIEGLVARAKHEEAMALLAEADFTYAKKDTGLQYQDANYSGVQLQAIQKAVFKLRQVLNAGPINQSMDFHIQGPDWVAHRVEIEQAFEELTEFADSTEDEELREAEMEDNFASMHPLRKGLPYEIYNRLKTIYGILLGVTSDLTSISNDWLEASILLTIWWNGAVEDKIQKWSFDVSQAYHPQRNDDSEDSIYLERLKQALLAVTDSSSKETFHLNPTSPLELGIASALQGDMPSALAMIQGFSLCIASATAEVGSSSGWLNANTLGQELNTADLLVLTMGASGPLISKDDILETYADQLFKTPKLEASSEVLIDGWEIAISVASRCDSRQVAKRLVGHFLEQLEITSADRASRLTTLCGELGFNEESRHVSEEYGDYLVNTSTEHGTALLCYARSRSENKVRRLIDLLNSYCLVQSQAYPAEDDMDPALSRLVSNPKTALQGIASADPEAVEILQFHLVGYACIRRYYTLRDGASTRKKVMAAKALTAAINSAADSIYGGLYDPSRESAIQVDGLLTLLGEATSLLAQHNDGKRVFSSNQLYAILAAIEDLQTVSDRVYTATEECFIAALRHYSGSSPPSPHAMLKKSISSGTNSNFSFSMMGSEMLARSEDSLGGKSMGSAVLVDKQGAKSTDEIQRGWDWRSNFKASQTTGADMLRYLRLNIAQELSIANLEDNA